MVSESKRLIDANKLSEKIGKMKGEITRNRGGYRYCNEEEKSEWDKLDIFDSLVCDAPAVDAVEVVRCKDCKHFDMQCMECQCDAIVSDNEGGADFSVNFCPDDFCSYGERRASHG